MREKKRKRRDSRGQKPLYFVGRFIVRFLGRIIEQQAKYDLLLLVVRPANEGMMKANT